MCVPQATWTCTYHVVSTRYVSLSWSVVSWNCHNTQTTLTYHVFSDSAQNSLPSITTLFHTLRRVRGKICLHVTPIRSLNFFSLLPAASHILCHKTHSHAATNSRLISASTNQSATDKFTSNTAHKKQKLYGSSSSKRCSFRHITLTYHVFQPTGTWNGT